MSAPLVDSPELRAARLKAYREGAYLFRAPPVCTARWEEQDWCNFVRFNDGTLTGWLPYQGDAA